MVITTLVRSLMLAILGVTVWARQPHPALAADPITNPDPDGPVVYGVGPNAPTALGVMRRLGYRVVTLFGPEAVFQGKQHMAICLMESRRVRPIPPVTGLDFLEIRTARYCYGLGPADPELRAEIDAVLKAKTAQAKP